MKYKAAVFDMDGTVLDTAGDLCDSMNHVMGQLGLPAGFTIEDTHYLFGSGVTVAVSRALAMLDGADYKTLLTVGTEEDEVTRTLDPALREKVQNMFRSYYGQHCSIKTGPYPGIPALLMRLREHGVHTAVVSNKPDPAVQELVDIHFKGLFDRALGESPAIRRKPEDCRRTGDNAGRGRLYRRYGDRPADGGEFRNRLHLCGLGVSHEGFPDGARSAGCCFVGG